MVPLPTSFARMGELMLPAAEAIEGIEGDQRHEHLASAQLEDLNVGARGDQRGPDRDML